MGQDEIIREVRAIRTELAAQHNYNVRELFEAAKRRQVESGRRVVRLRPRRVQELSNRSG